MVALVSTAVILLKQKKRFRDVHLLLTGVAKADCIGCVRPTSGRAVDATRRFSVVDLFSIKAKPVQMHAWVIRSK